MCGLKTPTYDTKRGFAWKLQTGKTPSRPTGPDAAVGGVGYYIYLEATGRNKGDFVQFV